MAIGDNESIALVGGNGAGKSTLLMHLNGSLLCGVGEIFIKGVKIEKRSLSEIRKSVGMIFQNSDDQLFMPTVFDDVAFGPLNMLLSKEEVIERVKKGLKAVGALHLKDKAPYHLSGGEKKRVAIASVLSMEPDILVMDEPTSNLDPKAQRELITLLNTFNHTKIIATHDLEFAKKVCQRVIVLSAGEIKADGEINKILSDDDFLRSHSL
jgi:cobalt/nickel transport system ATP-binding protein